MMPKQNQPVFDTITIAGVGLIGGSLGMAARHYAIARKVIGIGRNEQRLMKAKLLGAIDEYSLDHARGVSEADLFIVATPVRTIIPTIKALASHLKPGTVVTDVGSTKKEIVHQAAQVVPKNCSFVGGHPMAGSEKSGIEAASHDMFLGTTYVLTPTEQTSIEAIQKMSRFVESLGARVVVLSPEDHDATVALISHLPHVISAALLHTVTKPQIPEHPGSKHLSSNWVFGLAAGSFRDLTRISDSPPEIWRDICLTNAEKIAKAIDVLKHYLEQTQRAIITGNEDEILKFFEEARQIRQRYVQSREDQTSHNSH
ncbi:MAG: prephenate dehydrogenase [Armatimonadota bacterium]